MNDKNGSNVANQYGLLWLGISLALGIILSTLIAMKTVEKVKLANQTITVKGFAERRILSDLVVWQGNFSIQASTLAEAYGNLQRDHSTVMAYFKNKNIPTEAITVSPINTVILHARDERGMELSRVTGYRLSQTVEITSSDVKLITQISRESTELIKDGVAFSSYSPHYFYTKVDDLKVQMLGEATKDAKLRAEQLAINSGGKVGALRSAAQGVFQITSAHSTQVSDAGIYDTSTVEKSIKAVVTIQYSIR